MEQTIEQQRAIAIAKARRARAESKNADNSGVENFGLGLARGARDLIDGPAYLLPKGIEKISRAVGADSVADWANAEANKVSDINKAAETEYQNATPGSVAAGFGRVGGNVASAFIPGTGQVAAAKKVNDLWQSGNKLKSLAVAAPVGAAQASTFGTKTDDDSFLKNAALGALFAPAGQIGAEVISRVAKPINPTEAAQRLINEGIYPTPGASAGGSFKRYEDKLTSMPFIGAAIDMGKRNAIREANSAAISRGGMNVPAGHAGFRAMDDSFSQRWDDATKNLMFDVNDPAFKESVQKSIAENNLDAKGINDVNGFFNNLKNNLGFTSEAPATNAIPIGNQPLNQILGGNDLHDFLIKLRNTGIQLRKGLDPYAQRTGQAYRDIYNNVDSALQNQGLSNADDIANFRSVRDDWSRYVPAKNAAESNVAARSDGIFTPLQYSNEVAKNAKKMGNAAQLRHGNANNQQFASDMVNVLGDSYPDSGTAGRLSAMSIATGLPGFIASIPGWAANTQAGRKYMSGALSPLQEQTAEIIRKLGPLFVPATDMNGYEDVNF